jgi:uncharacterized membrane protein YgcG
MRYIAALTLFFSACVACTVYAAPDLGKVLKTNNAAGIPGDTTTKAVAGQGAPEAYAYLCTISNVGCGESIKGLNPAFAQCLAKFLKASPGIRISSAYRSVGHQAQLFQGAIAKYGSAQAARKWVAPPGKSNHGRGIAVDLSYFKNCNSQCNWAHANAANFGLTFPMSWEKWHIQPSGGSCNNGQAASNSQNDLQNQADGAQQQPPNPSDGGAQGNGGSESGGGGSPSGAGSPSGGGSSGGGESPSQPNQQSLADCPAGAVTDFNLGTCSAPKDVRPTYGEKKDAQLDDTNTDASKPLTEEEKKQKKIDDAKKKAEEEKKQKDAEKAQKREAKLTLEALPTEALRGETVQVHWVAKNVTSGSCVLEGTEGTSVEATSGTVESAPLRVKKNTFTLTCTARATNKAIQKQVDVPVVKKRTEPAQEDLGTE